MTVQQQGLRLKDQGDEGKMLQMRLEPQVRVFYAFFWTILILLHCFLLTTATMTALGSRRQGQGLENGLEP